MNLIGKNRVERFSIKKISIDQWVDAEDHLAVEAPLEIQLSYGAIEKTQITISVTMRTPGHDEELAIGFLFTEGILQIAEQIASVKSFAENRILIALHDHINPSLQKAERNFYTTSSCGVCGKSSIDAIRTVSLYQNVSDDTSLEPGVFFGMEEHLRAHQSIFESTGGLHASALFDLHGNFIMLYEDVGRHNALDKVIGAAFMKKQLPLTRTILMLSGRVSFELIQKASMAGIKIVAAIGAPSSLAVELATELDMTLIGFLRNQRFNIYSGWRRIGKVGRKWKVGSGKWEVES